MKVKKVVVDVNSEDEVVQSCCRRMIEKAK